MSSFPAFFQLEFHGQVSRLGRMWEEDLFRALQRTFQALSTSFHIEEYHGRKSWVRFNSIEQWKATSGLCELADVLLVTFRTSGEIRISFLQCKRVSGVFAAACEGGLSEPFEANNEQWDLLHNRPQITGVGFHRPPSDILSSALLPTVGSFGMFYPKRNTYEMYFSSAANLVRAGASTGVRGELELSLPPHSNLFGEFHESGAACCSLTFAEGMDAGIIGTPIHRAAKGVNANHAASARAWLRTSLRYALANSATWTDEPRVLPLFLSLLTDDTVGIDETARLPTRSVVIAHLNEEGVITRRN